MWLKTIQKIWLLKNSTFTACVILLDAETRNFYNETLKAYEEDRNDDLIAVINDKHDEISAMISRNEHNVEADENTIEKYNHLPRHHKKSRRMILMLTMILLLNILLLIATACYIYFFTNFTGYPLFIALSLFPMIWLMSLFCIFKQCNKYFAERNHPWQRLSGSTR